MGSPYRVEVHVREHVVEGDIDACTERLVGDIVVAHTQHIHPTEFDPIVSPVVDRIDGIRTLQLLVGAIAVLLVKIARQDFAAACEIIKVMAESLREYVLRAGETSCEGGEEGECSSVGTGAKCVLDRSDQLTQEQRKLVRLSTRRDPYRGRQ